MLKPMIAYAAAAITLMMSLSPAQAAEHMKKDDAMQTNEQMMDDTMKTDDMTDDIMKKDDMMDDGMTNDDMMTPKGDTMDKKDTMMDKKW
jgi:hypothetical protein